MIQQNRHRFVVLDSLRGICACFVVLFHVAKGSSGIFGSSAIIANAWLFVDFFFVLSGVMISVGYSEKLAQGYPARSFMLLRLGRVWPVHILVLMLMVSIEVVRAVAALAGHGAGGFRPGHSLYELATSFFFLNSFGLYDRLSWNWPSWSIEAEVWVYLIFAVITLSWGRYALLAAALLNVIAFAILRIHGPGNLDVTYDLGFIRCLYGFTLGMVITPFVTGGKRGGRGDTAMELAIVALILWMIATLQDELTLSLPSMFALAVIIFAKEGGALSAILKRPLFRWLGLWSFSIYMLHGLIQLCTLAALGWLGRRFGLELAAPRANQFSQAIVTPPWIADGLILLILLLVIACAALCFRYYEEPARLAARRLADALDRRAASSRNDPPLAA